MTVILSDILRTALNEIKDSKTLTGLDDIRVRYLGKKGKITSQLKLLGSMDPNEKPIFGQEINKTKQRIEDELQLKKSELKKFDKLSFLFSKNKYKKPKSKKKWTVVELFAGSGGLALGFEKAGLKCLFANDIDRDSCETLKKNRPKIVCGFAAETHSLINNARKKLINKNCDFIFANKISNKFNPMGNDFNQISVIGKNNQKNWSRMSKKKIAEKIIQEISSYLN